MPDVLGITILGSFFAIEIKKPDHKTKKDRAEKQKEFLELVRDTPFGRAIQVESVFDVAYFVNNELIPLVKRHDSDR